MSKAKSLLNLLENSNDRWIKEFVRTLLWSENDEEGQPLDDKYGYEDMSAEALQKIKKDVDKFLDQASDLIDNDKTLGSNYAQAMHDFCLTRNGHGAGFWDGDWSNGDELTKIAKSFGELNAYVGDDNKIYTMQ
jgi:hypothetical protein